MSRVLLFLGCVLGAAATNGIAGDPPVFSGPQVGEKVTPFKVLGVYDESKGQEFDFVTMAGDRPFMLVFVHTPTRPAGDLSRALLHYADTREQAGLFSALIYLTNDMTEAERSMVRAYGWWNCGPPAGISFDGAEGPGAYGLNRNVTMTVLIGRDRKVTANFPLIQPSDSDAARIIPSITKLVGGEIPSLPEVEFLRSPSRLPPIVNMWERGKTPTDTKLRILICRLLRESDDSERAAGTVAEINEHVVGKPTLQAELGETSRLVLDRRYGSRPPIIKLVPKLTAPFTTWEEKYFAPPILAEN